MRGTAVIKAIVALVLTPLAALVLTFFLPKEYTSSVGVLVDTSIPTMDPTNPESKIDELINFGRGRNIQTNIDILLGSQVIGEAIELTRAEDTQGKFGFNNDKIIQLIDLLPRRLRVDSQKDSEVVTLRVTLDDPDLAAAIANNIGRAYIRVTQKMANNYGEKAKDLVAERLRRTTEQLLDIDRKIDETKRQYGMADLATDASVYSRTRADLELREVDLQARYNGAVAELAQAQRTLAGTPQWVDVVVQKSPNPNYTQLVMDLNMAKAQLAQERKKYTDDRPEVKALTGRVAQIQEDLNAIEREVIQRTERQLNQTYVLQEQTVNRVKEQLDSIGKQLAQTKADRSKLEQELVVFPQAERTINDLLRQRQIQERTYMELSARKDSLDAVGPEPVGRVANAYIVSDARANPIPSAPNVTLYVLAGFGLGIAIAAIIILPKGSETQDYYPPAGLSGPPTTVASMPPSGDDTPKLKGRDG